MNPDTLQWRKVGATDNLEVATATPTFKHIIDRLDVFVYFGRSDTTYFFNVSDEHGIQTLYKIDRRALESDPDYWVEQCKIRLHHYLEETNDAT